MLYSGKNPKLIRQSSKHLDGKNIDYSDRLYGRQVPLAVISEGEGEDTYCYIGLACLTRNW